MNKNLIYIILGIVGTALRVMANDGAEHHSAELTPETLKTIIYQAINVSAIVLGLVYFLRASIGKYFEVKKATYLAAAEKAKVARAAAEQERMHIQVQLSKLISTADESVARAKVEASEMKSQLLVEANAISKRIRDEALATVALEIEKAKITLRETLIKDAFVVAEQGMHTKVTSDDHDRLQGEFINNIELVQR